MNESSCVSSMLGVWSCNVEALVADLNSAPWSVMGSYDDCCEYSAVSRLTHPTYEDG